MLVAVWLYGALALDASASAAPTERPNQAYAHAIMAEYLLAHGDTAGARDALRYALIFDHDNASLKARLDGLSAPIAKVEHKAHKRTTRTAWLKLKKRTLDPLQTEDKTQRRVAESKAD